jgi:AcrR family transcriptional regulator
MVDASSEKLPAHRPSRRHLIIDAAVRVFARQGFVDASVQDVAEEAQVVPNAIYYHFSGKEELFDAALRHAMELIDEATDAARAKATSRDANTLRAVTDAVWDWLEDHPDEGQLLYSHLPGATPRARALWEEFEDRHVRQALDYLDEVRGPRPGYSAAANKAAQMYTGRTLISLLIVLHPLRMEGGPLAEHSSRALRRAANDVAASLIAADPPVPSRSATNGSSRTTRTTRRAG